MYNLKPCENVIGKLVDGSDYVCGNETIVKQVLVHKTMGMLGYGTNLCVKCYVGQKEVMPKTFEGTDIEVVYLFAHLLELACEINQDWNENFDYNIDNEPCGREPRAYFHGGTKKYYRVMRLLLDNQDIDWLVWPADKNGPALLTIRASQFYELCKRYRYAQLAEKSALKPELREKLIPIIFKACVYR